MNKIKVMLSICLLMLFAISVLADEAVDYQRDKYPVRFVIMGDRTGGAVPGIYEQMVIEAERLKPDFVITVGDMIEGYTEDTVVLHNEWLEYLQIVDIFSMPIYYVPGNHDITSDPLEDFYVKYTKQKPYYSFDHRGLHFVVLDNARYSKTEEWPEKQLEWLKNDLSENRDATLTLLFFHKPFWYNTLAKGESDLLHDILVENGVDVVFTGHYHRYFVGEYDGIKYTCIGSSGGGMSPGPTGLGFHIAWVTVTNDEIFIAPIKKGGILPWDEVTAEELYFANKIDDHAIRINNKVAVSNDLKISKASISITVQNLNDNLELNDTLVWDIPEGWTIEPTEIAVSLPPNHF